MEIVSVCQEMKWDYHIYMAQPSWFLELLKAKFQIDSQRMKKEAFKRRKKFNN